MGYNQPKFFWGNSKFSMVKSTDNNSIVIYWDINGNMAVCQNLVPLVNIKIAGIYGCSSL